MTIANTLGKYITYDGIGNVNLVAPTGNLELSTVIGKIELIAADKINIGGPSDIGLASFSNNISIEASINLDLISDTANITATATAGNIVFNSSTTSITSSGTITITSPNLIFGGDGAGTLTTNGFSIINIGSDPATSGIQIGKTGAFLQIIGAIPGTPPVGSVALMWDPVGNQIYHV